MESRCQPEPLFFAHCHSDHYSRQLAQEVRTLWPGVKLVLPQQEFSHQVLLSRREVRFSHGNLTLRFLRLPHEGNPAIPHYGLLLSTTDFCILISGGCETASPLLAEYLDGVSVDLAVLTFPRLTLRRGLRYLEGNLRPRRLFLYHLPFPEDDVNNYLVAASRAAGIANLPDVPLLTHPLQRETV